MRRACPFHVVLNGFILIGPIREFVPFGLFFVGLSLLADLWTQRLVSQIVPLRLNLRSFDNPGRKPTAAEVFNDTYRIEPLLLLSQQDRINRAASAFLGGRSFQLGLLLVFAWLTHIDYAVIGLRYMNGRIEMLIRNVRILAASVFLGCLLAILTIQQHDLIVIE